jgi:toxin YoeB
VNVAFSSRSWAEYRYWQDNDPKILERLNRLIEECRRHPFKGTGKPEPLGGNLSGWWSRRIDSEHRLIYRVSGKDKDQVVQIAQCRYHY